jgi:colanic acid/amylovoran biosynthesis glycosyltransferase
MKQSVLHLIRKNTHLKASFIQNQIENHIEFDPKVIFYESRVLEGDGGFASWSRHDSSIHKLINGHTLLDKYKYKVCKILGRASKKELLSEIEKLNPTVIHLHYGTDAGLFLGTLRNLDIPKVVSFYGYDCSGFPNKYLGLGRFYLNYRTFRYADKVLAMSEDMKRDLLRVGCPEDKIVVHYHGSKVKVFRVVRSYENRPIVQFLIISGFTAQKGHIFLLEAFKKALACNPKIHLTIVGSGPERNNIIETIKRLELENHVDVKPFVVYASKEHIKYLTNSDVFIHPSLTNSNGDKEGIPGAIVEAMAAGLPIVSTTHAGIPSIIENRVSGLLVAEWDISDLSRKIVDISRQRKLREELGINAQNYALNYLDLKAKQRNLEQIYMEAAQD